jgi:carboxyl-terminal processing protease
MRFTHFPPILVILLATLLVTGGYQWGVWSAGQQIDQPANITSGGAVATTAPAGVSFGLFWEAWNVLHERFLKEPDDAVLEEGAIEGMVNALDDPYTVYLDPEAAKDLEDGLGGVFSGIGAEVAVKNRRLLIVAPLPDSPAEKAGLKPQDEIQKIDGELIGEMTFLEAIRKIRGPDGSTVTVTIDRDGFTEPRDVPVIRGKIVVKSVEYEVRADGVGYLKITGFHKDTTNLAQAALDEFVAKGVSGIVLDLRANPGGLLDQGINIASLFLAKDSQIVKQKNRTGGVQTYTTSSVAAKAPSIKLVILVDKGSASASEIVAGALQDFGRAKLIGETTFGKGSVQQLENLRNGGQLKVTVAEWLTPKDRLINGTGIDPDIVVVNREEDEQAGKDSQLDRALEELKK